MATDKTSKLDQLRAMRETAAIKKIREGLAVTYVEQAVTPNADVTPNSVTANTGVTVKGKRGRQRTGKAMSNADRQRKYRARKSGRA